MATQKPRITITITQRQHDLFKAISGFSGQPMSAFIGEMLEAATPTLERMASTLQKVKTAQEKERSRFIEGLGEAQAALEPIVMNTIGQFDLFMGKIERSLGDEGDPACGGASSPNDPLPAPATNRGATDPSAGRRKPKRSKAEKPNQKPAVLKKTAATTGHKKRGAA